MSVGCWFTKTGLRMKPFASLICLTLCGAIACGGSCGCSTAPRPVAKENSEAVSPASDTTIGRAMAANLAAHPGESPFYPLALGTEAFAARLALIRVAERSVDVQYYMVHGDDTGRALLGELLHAADRGVRVRFLVDDIHTGRKEDRFLAVFDSHPQIEVRVFNPFHRRSARWLDFLFDYARVNRRMHNKSLTADNQLTIVGGRNIGNEYFAANKEVNFSDLDVLAGGPVVPQVSSVFDEYWASSVVFPITALVDRPDEETIRMLRAQLEESLKQVSETEYIRALPDLSLIQAMRERRLQPYWGTCSVMADQPTKVTLPTSDDATHAIPQFMELLSAAKQELFLVSPYFIPGDGGARWLESLAQRGVRVRVLTNSCRATDVGAVHAGYARYRTRLLKSGVELYELKPTASKNVPRDAAHGYAFGSRASLHTKAYMVDRHTLFIGSLNLDPRSVRLNTEMGLVLNSASLAEHLAGPVDARLLDDAYRVELRPSDGRMIWRTRENGSERVYDSEPDVGWCRSIRLFMTGLLPIEEQL